MNLESLKFQSLHQLMTLFTSANHSSDVKMKGLSTQDRKDPEKLVMGLFKTLQRRRILLIQAAQRDTHKHAPDGRSTQRGASWARAEPGDRPQHETVNYYHYSSLAINNSIDYSW